MSLVGNWQREAARFAPQLRVHVHHGAERLRGDALRERLAVTRPGRHHLRRWHPRRRRAARIDWQRVVLDEAQAIKNAARPAKAVRRLRAAHRVALTGTPVENRLADLWSIMEFLNPGLLGSAEPFRARYAMPIERHGATETPPQRLRALTGPFVLRRLKTDRSIIADLPEKIEMKEYCNLTAEQASLYQAVVDDMLEKIEDAEGIERRGLVLATMTKLKQVCNHPAQLLHDGRRSAGRSGKLARLEEMLEEVLAEGDRALCFTQFAEFGRDAAPHLAARFGPEVAVPARRHAEDSAATRWSSGSSPSTAAAALPAVAEGRRHRPEPDRRQPRHPLRPLVEPGGRGPGHRPRVPHRPAAQRAGPQVRLRRHGGGADRRR